MLGFEQFATILLHLKEVTRIRFAGVRAPGLCRLPVAGCSVIQTQQTVPVNLNYPPANSGMVGAMFTCAGTRKGANRKYVRPEVGGSLSATSAYGPLTSSIRHLKTVQMSLTLIF